MALVLNVIFSTVRSTTFEMPFFTFIDKLEYILYFSKKTHHLVGSLDLAMLCYYKVYYFRTLLALCFTLISLH